MWMHARSLFSPGALGSSSISPSKHFWSHSEHRKAAPNGHWNINYDELPWVSRCLGTGTRSFLQSMPAGQSPRTQQLQSMGHPFPLLSPHPHSSSTCSPRDKQSPSFPWDLGKDLCTLRRWVPQLQSFIFPACKILQHRDRWWEVRANMWLSLNMGPGPRTLSWAG